MQLFKKDQSVSEPGVLSGVNEEPYSSAATSKPESGTAGDHCVSSVGVDR